MTAMTYGVMPTREQFDEACARVEDGRSVDEDGFGFGNDPRLGNCRLTSSELWDELTKAHAEYEEQLSDDGVDPEVVGSWISCVLGCLGFEWV